MDKMAANWSKQPDHLALVKSESSFRLYLMPKTTYGRDVENNSSIKITLNHYLSFQ